MNQPVAHTNQLKLHPAMIYSVIHAQAGSLSKAIAELVCNSIDAGATRIDITLNNRSYEITDDGRGFSTRDTIDQYFETFGTPHAEGDARYGRFRIGRGQAFSYSRSHWFSGCFEMMVDVKNRGMDYTLLEYNEPVFHGCRIVGELYDPLSPSDYDACDRDLRQLVAYVSIPVFINGQQVNTDPATRKWDVETGDAYIKYKASGTLKIYNLGVFVREYSGRQFGCGGEVVSKVAFQVNTARNDVLVSQCAVWKRIRKYLVAQSTEKNIRAARLDDVSRQNLIMQFVNGDLSYDSIKNAKIVTLSGRQCISLDQLSRSRLPLTAEPEDGSRAADVLMSRKLAVVLARRTLDEFNADSDKVFLDLVASLIDRHGEQPWLARPFRCMARAEFDVLASSIDSDQLVLMDKELDKRDRLLMAAIRAGNVEFIRRLNWCRADEHLGDLVTRTVFAGRADTAAAWTDGASTVVLTLQEIRKGHSGLQGFNEVALTLLHEYLHDTNDSGAHLHDAEFYERFHRYVFAPAQPASRAAVTMFREYLKGLKKASIRIPRRLLHDADMAFQLSERLSDTDTPAGHIVSQSVDC